MSDPQAQTPAPRGDILYVHRLNEPELGPLGIEAALDAASRHMFIAPKARERTREDFLAGGAGPWHFTYGFTSVSIQIGPGARSL